jgi:hypothetical protein
VCTTTLVCLYDCMWEGVLLGECVGVCVGMCVLASRCVCRMLLLCVQVGVYVQVCV